jgi:3',5'-cyclic AMP phosphodiesterase CpdA
MAHIVTLAHLSDVHLAPIAGFAMRYWNVKRMLGFANWQRGRVRVHLRAVADQIAADVRAQGPSHIAVTGDLANLGLPEEYQQALSWLARLGPPDGVSVVPGNHDIYSGRMRGASCLQDWAAYIASDAWGTDRFTRRGAGTRAGRRLGACGHDPSSAVARTSTQAPRVRRCG